MLAVALATLALSITACASPAPTPAPTSTAVPTPSGPASVSTAAELGGTKWIGTDSDGDKITIKFLTDGHAAYISYGSAFAYPEDTWTANGDAVTWQLTLGAKFGVLSYTGKFDAAKQEISASIVSSSLGTTSTIVLHQAR